MKRRVQLVFKSHQKRIYSFVRFNEKKSATDGIRYRKTPLYDWLILWRSEAEALLEALACPKHPVYVDLKQELSENMAHVKAWLSNWLREAAKHIAIVEVKPLEKLRMK